MRPAGGASIIETIRGEAATSAVASGGRDRRSQRGSVSLIAFTAGWLSGYARRRFSLGMDCDALRTE
jgi:hypothetical protein